MKKLLMLCSVFLLSGIQIISAQGNTVIATAAMVESTPLSGYSSLYNLTKFSECNTAANASYLTKNEKEVIWILNLIKTDPRLFLDSVLLNKKSPYFQAVGYRDNYFLSLISDLKKTAPCKILLYPDPSAFLSAQCHAISSGKIGYVGHERKSASCQADFFGECCDYGNNDALSILLHLLIDQGVPSLGHRHICLDGNYAKIGVSIQPHAAYSNTCVLDFK